MLRRGVQIRMFPLKEIMHVNNEVYSMWTAHIDAQRRNGPGSL